MSPPRSRAVATCCREKPPGVVGRNTLSRGQLAGEEGVVTWVSCIDDGASSGRLASSSTARLACPRVGRLILPSTAPMVRLACPRVGRLILPSTARVVLA